MFGLASQIVRGFYVCIEHLALLVSYFHVAENQNVINGAKMVCVKKKFLFTSFIFFNPKKKKNRIMAC